MASADGNLAVGLWYISAFVGRPAQVACSVGGLLELELAAIDVRKKETDHDILDHLIYQGVYDPSYPLDAAQAQQV